MTVTKNSIDGKWLELKGDLQKAWGRLTDDEIEKTKGDLKSIRGLIVQKYGAMKKEHESKLSEIIKKAADTRDKGLEAVKKSLKQ